MCMRMMVLMILRTGEMFDTSTARLTIMATAILSQDKPSPQVAGQFEELFREWHRLVEIRQEVAK